MHTKIVVEVEIRLTEDKDKVLRAVKNIVDVETLTTTSTSKGEILVGEASSPRALLPLYQAVRAERILDAVRNALKKNRRENSTHLLLHKQAAYAGRISIVDSDRESPLGAIKLTIIRDNIDEIIDWLAPPTSRGKPIWEKPMPEY
ncbi:MAG: RNA-binding domain-containing protein [Acidilobaceae archaeon]